MNTDRKKKKMKFNEKEMKNGKIIKPEAADFFSLSPPAVQYLRLAGGLSVAFLHLDPSVAGGGIFGGVCSRERLLLAGRAGLSRVLRLRRLGRSLLHRR